MRNSERGFFTALSMGTARGLTKEKTGKWRNFGQFIGKSEILQNKHDETFVSLKIDEGPERPLHSKNRGASAMPKQLVFLYAFCVVILFLVNVAVS